jgi:hypothetical protein
VASARAALVVAGLLLAACSDAVLPQVTTWEADLRPSSPSSRLLASVGAISQPGRAEVSIQMGGGDTGRSYSWRIVGGSCEGPGDTVGGQAVYPVLQADAQGGATDETVLSRELAPEGSYAALLFRLDPDGGEIRAACGEMERTR